MQSKRKDTIGKRFQLKINEDILQEEHQRNKKLQNNKKALMKTKTCKQESMMAAHNSPAMTSA